MVNEHLMYDVLFLEIFLENIFTWESQHKNHENKAVPRLRADVKRAYTALRQRRDAHPGDSLEIHSREMSNVLEDFKWYSDELPVDLFAKLYELILKRNMRIGRETILRKLQREARQMRSPLAQAGPRMPPNAPAHNHPHAAMHAPITPRRLFTNEERAGKKH